MSFLNRPAVALRVANHLAGIRIYQNEDDDDDEETSRGTCTERSWKEECVTELGITGTRSCSISADCKISCGECVEDRADEAFPGGGGGGSAPGKIIIIR